jgi:hypothetical protein
MLALKFKSFGEFESFKLTICGIAADINDQNLPICSESQP